MAHERDGLDGNLAGQRIHQRADLAKEIASSS